MENNKDYLSIRDVLEYSKTDISSIKTNNQCLTRRIKDNSLLHKYYAESGVFVKNKSGFYPNLILSGVPGCGKTNLSNVLIIKNLLESDKMIFYCSPTRPLAQEVYSKLSKDLKGIIEPDEIIISTGDQAYNDWKIYQHRIKVCCTIFEKALGVIRFAPNLLKSVSLFIVDEAHMFNDEDRGVNLDALLTTLEQVQNKNIRIVLLTVESGDVLDIFKEKFTYSVNNDRVIPLIISSNTRPYPTKHRIALSYGRRNKYNGVDNLYEETDLLDQTKDLVFNPNEKLSLDAKENINNLKGEILKKKNINNKVTEKISYEIIDKIITNNRLKRVLVVILSHGRLAAVAHNCYQKRKNSFSQEACKKLAQAKCIKQFFYKLDSLYHRGLISQKQKKFISDYASFGIFIHSGYLHSELRSIIEEIFQNNRESDNCCLILFSTTTLAYGVNLRLDAVLLTSVSFRKDKAFDAITYNNIMGRTGRFKSYAGLSYVVLNYLDEQIKFIPYFYSNNKLRLLTPNPIKGSNSFDNNRIRFFLHFLVLHNTLFHQDTSLFSLSEFEKKSIHFKAIKDSEQNLIQKQLEETTNYLIEFSKKNLGDIEIINCNKQIVASDIGRAIVDTGGTLDDVCFLYKWAKFVLELINKNRNNNSTHTGKIPDYKFLYILGIILTPKVFEKIPGFFSIDSSSNNPIDSLYKQLITSELNKLNFHEDSSSLLLSKINEILKEKSLNFQIDTIEFDYLKNLKNKLKRALIGMFLWINGADLDEIYIKLGLNGAPNSILPYTLFEMSSWTARLFHLAFGYHNELLNKGQTETIMELEFQLRFGGPYECTPFFFQQSEISRKRILSIYKELNIKPEYFLLGSNKYDLTKDIEERKKITDIVTNFFLGQIESFLMWGEQYGVDLAIVSEIGTYLQGRLSGEKKYKRFLFSNKNYHKESPIRLYK